jgi:hypothetical protein
MSKLLALLALCAGFAFAQVATTSTLDGTVTDPQGALVVGAKVVVQNTDTGQNLETTTDEHGHWVVPSMPAANYRITITMQGFRTTAVDGVKMDAGVPKTVPVKLEIGQVSETVEVTTAADLVQTTNATVASTLQGRQVFELPFTSRNGMDLLVGQPGTQTGTTPRTSFVNGLPLSALSVTMDGINTQDNYYKNGDAFFTLIPARPDSLEEITLSTSAAGADSTAQGAAQVKFITKGGTNDYHGGVFWQHRNTALDANSFFNNDQGLARNKVILNQGGAHAGGPIVKNKLLFFTNFEIYRYPAQTSVSRTVMDPGALDGTFKYATTGGGVGSVNVLKLAAANGFTGTADPIIAQTLTQINALTPNGNLQQRIATNSDYNRNNLLFQPKGLTQNYYDTTRLDYNISSKHSFQLVYTYLWTKSSPDITNSVVNIFPGTGGVLGFNDLIPTQGGNRWAVVGALRSQFTSNLTNELRFGANRSITLFRSEISSPALFNEWRGYYPTLNYVTSPAAVSGSSRRTSPMRELHDAASWLKGSHLFSFGFDMTQVNLWYVTVGTSVIPQVSFAGLQNGDPINTGTTGIFNTANFPGATTTNLSDARAMYALLAGRVYSFSRSMALDGSTHQYANVPATEIDRQYEGGGFLTDTWRAVPGLTITLGLRFERQGAFQNTNQVYSSVSYASAWGTSGIDRMFQPGATGGVSPTYDKYTSPYKAPNMWSPSLGIAWQLPGMSGPMGFLLGKDKGGSVLRGGYNIATTREGTYTFQSIYGSNQGFTYGLALDPISYPTDFGAPGSVLFRNATLPTRSYPSSPQYPIAPLPTNSLNAFDPNLKMGYVQSWNIGLQRQLNKNTVIEVRYTGNHGLHEWRQVNINEVNLFESGFLKEFAIARNNLMIARGGNINNTAASTNFGNQGLPGQQNIPLIQTGLGYTSDTTTSDYLRQNRPSSIASNIYSNTANMARLVAAGYPSNLFIVNPAVPSGGSYIVTNGGMSNYNAMQVELRRRLASGISLQASYAWSHSIINGASSDYGDYNEPTTFRNTRLDRISPTYDIRHGFKMNGIYELPFGAGRRYLSATPVLKKVLEGWEIAGVGRMQSGTPFRLTSGRSGMNGNETGVVLNNITNAQLQDMVQIRKTTSATATIKDYRGNVFAQPLVYWLPQSFIDNSAAAFELGGKSWAQLDANAPYVGPQLAPNSFGYQVYLRNPWQYHLDLSAVKRTKINERVNVEFRAQFLNALNLTDFFVANGPSSSLFGQTTSAYNDFSGSADPGSRVIEFVLRVNF